MFPTHLNIEAKLLHDGRLANCKQPAASTDNFKVAGQTVTFFAYQSWHSNLSINMEARVAAHAL